MSGPNDGDLAPSWSLASDGGGSIGSDTLKGRPYVLYLYPKDDTPGCTTESCEFRDAYATYQDAGAEVWGISILGSGSKAAFKAKFGLPFALIADEEHQVAEQYGVWVEKQNYGKTYMGIARVTFLIAPDGRIARVWDKVKPEGHAEAVLAAIAEASAQAA